MKEFDKFTNELINELENQLKGVTVSAQDVIKNNGLKLRGLLFQNEGNMSPVIYINDYYEQYLEEKNLIGICENIKQIYLTNCPNHDFNVSKIMNFDNIKSEIVYELINYERNVEFLRDVPYIRFLDLAIVFKIVLSEFEMESATILIHNSFLDMWNVEVDELYALAKENTYKIYGVDFANITECIANLLDDEIMEQLEEKLSMYILTNCRKVNGASCILYEGLLDKIARGLQDDLCIIPSSVHETIIAPASCISENELKETVKFINGTELAIHEILSDNIYFYSREKGEITM